MNVIKLFKIINDSFALINNSLALSLIINIYNKTENEKIIFIYNCFISLSI